MWLFTRYGFYSIACALKQDGTLDPDQVMVRARVMNHLKNLQKRFPQLKGVDILTLPRRDYLYRLLVPKQVWSMIIAELAEEQNWSNFKTEAARYQGVAGSAYIHALHAVWNTMYELQDNRFSS